ncbi:MAG: hypothetical protein ACREA2_19595 [Blastocatellia bacterium]
MAKDIEAFSKDNTLKWRTQCNAERVQEIGLLTVAETSDLITRNRYHRWIPTLIMAGINEKYFFIKKLKRGHCYPVPPKEAKIALSDAVQANLGRVFYKLQTSKKTLVSAQYNGKTSRDQGAIDLAMFSVPLEEREEARNLLAQEILPLLEAWVEDVEQKGEYWRRFDHNVVFRAIKGKVVIEEDQRNWLI